MLPSFLCRNEVQILGKEYAELYVTVFRVAFYTKYKFGAAKSTVHCSSRCSPQKLPHWWSHPAPGSSLEAEHAITRECLRMREGRKRASPRPSLNFIIWYKRQLLNFHSATLEDFEGIIIDGSSSSSVFPRRVRCSISFYVSHCEHRVGRHPLFCSRRNGGGLCCG